jgi:ribosomal protein S18 acetylase RimI-like enzyme
MSAQESSISYRFVKPSDLPALEWDGEFIHFRRLYADIYKRVERGDGLMWVAEIPNAGIIGQLFISLSSNRPELSDGWQRAYIYGFRIRPAYRNRGIGSGMMRVVETDLEARGYRLVTLNVAQNNPGALRLYERLGYRVVGYEPGEWSYLDHLGKRREVKEPAWRMEKKLDHLKREVKNDPA